MSNIKELNLGLCECVLIANDLIYREKDSDRFEILLEVQEFISDAILKLRELRKYGG